MPAIRIPGPLRHLTNGDSSIATTATTVRAALADLDATFPAVRAKIFDAAGTLKPFIRLYVGADDIDALQGLDTPLAAKDELSIVSAVAGGRDA